MTTIKEVEKALLELSEHKVAKEWYHNDIIKIKLAKHYDDWISDINDHHFFMTLVEHIETCIDNAPFIDYLNSPSDYLDGLFLYSFL